MGIIGCLDGWNCGIGVIADLRICGIVELQNWCNCGIAELWSCLFAELLM